MAGSNWNRITPELPELLIGTLRNRVPKSGKSSIGSCIPVSRTPCLRPAAEAVVSSLCNWPLSPLTEVSVRVIVDFEVAQGDIEHMAEFGWLHWVLCSE